MSYDLRYLDHDMLDKIIYVWNIKGLHHKAAKIKFVAKTQFLYSI